MSDTRENEKLVTLPRGANGTTNPKRAGSNEANGLLTAAVGGATRANFLPLALRVPTDRERVAVIGGGEGSIAVYIHAIKVYVVPWGIGLMKHIRVLSVKSTDCVWLGYIRRRIDKEIGESSRFDCDREGRPELRKLSHERSSQELRETTRTASTAGGVRERVERRVR
jgi:hypothetical protein